MMPVRALSFSGKAAPVPAVAARLMRRSRVERAHRVGASSGQVPEEKSEGDASKEAWKETWSPSQIFGSYLQVGVWVTVLSLAAYKGIEKAQENPEEVGMLLAPPGAALLLISAFLLYRFTVGKADYEA